MKKAIIAAVMLTLSCLSYGQPIEKDAAPTIGQEFRKAGTQKRIGIATLAAGSTLALVGGILLYSEYGDGLMGGTGYNDGVGKTGEVLFFGGLGLVVASALFLEPSRKHGRQAKVLPAQPFVAMEKVPQPQHSYPSLGIRVRL